MNNETSVNLLNSENEAKSDNSNYSEIAIAIYVFLNSKAFFIILAIVWPLLIVLGVVGNGLVIYIAIAYRKLNDITNFYIFNLAITDLLFILFCIPFTTYLYMYDDWLLGVAFCKMNHFFSHASVQSTCLTLTAMTINRCSLIMSNRLRRQTLVSSNKQHRQVLFILIIIWIVSLFLASPDLFYFNVVYHKMNNETSSQCRIDLNTYSILKYYISIANFVSIATTYAIPLIIIIISYGRLMSHLSQNMKNLNSDRNGTSNEEFSLNSLENSKTTTVKSRQQKNSEQKMKKVTIMIILVTLNFAIGWLPTHLFIIIRRIRTIDPNTNEYVYLQVFKIVAHTLSYLTPVVNVCLYAFFNENFQKPLKEIYLKLVCKHDKQNRVIFTAQPNGEVTLRNRSGSLKTAVV